MKKLIYTILFMMFACGSVGHSDDFDRSQLLKLLGSTGMGSEHYLSFHPFSPSGDVADKITIYVASNRDREVRLTIPGKGYSKTLDAIPGGVIEFDLTAKLACPYTKLPGEQPLPEQVFVGYGIYIISEAEIVVYGMIEYANTSEGFLATPVSRLGKEYIVSSWPDAFGGSEENNYSSYTSIIAVYDKTTVRVEYGGEDWTETAGGKKPGEMSTFNMNAGDVVCIGTISNHGDLTGTKIDGNKPFSVISGSYCAGIPSGSAKCNVLIEAEKPTNAWSLDYHISKISGSSGKSILRIFARENATQIFKDGKPFGFIPKSGGISGEGWLEYRAFETDSTAFVISGDKPISVTQYNQGSDEAGAESGAFQMLMSTRESYQEEYIFPTPGLNSGSGFDNNYLNLVYEVTELGTIPDDLKLGKFEDSVVVWEQINAIDSDPGAEFEYSLKDKRYFSKTIKLPGNGIYRVKAKDPFAGYAYGHSDGKSYGFPLGGGYFDLSIPDTVPPNVEWTIDCLGNVSGTVTDMPDDIDYRSNLSLIYMESANSYNFQFRYEAFVAGETRSTTFTLKVIDTQQEGRAVLIFSDRRGNDTTVIIEFYPTLFSIHEDDFDFGELAVGEINEYIFWIVNDSQVKDLELSELNLQFGNQGFEIINSPVPAIVPPLDSVSFNVVFTATERGAFEDSIGVGDTCVFRYAAYIKASVGAPRIAVGSYDFGCIKFDDSKYGMITVSNIGSSSLEIYKYIGPTLKPIFEVQDWSAFNEMGDDPTYDDPWRLKPGIEQVFEVKFTPEAEGDFSDSIVFISNTGRPEGIEIDSVAELSGCGEIADGVSDNFLTFENIKLMPSPVQDILIIQNEGAALTTDKITIIDLSGRTVIDEKINILQGRYEINTSSLQNGVYILRIHAGDRVASEKFSVGR